MDWKGTILGYFSGLSERDLSNYGGYNEFISLYNSTFGNDRNDLSAAIGEIINDKTSEKEIVITLLHLAAILRIAELRPYVEQFQTSGRFASDATISKMLNYYNAVC